MVGRGLVVGGDRGEGCEARAADIFALVRGPLRDLRPCVRSAVEEIAAAGVADVPGVEVADPAIHGRAGDGLRIGDEAGEPSGFMHAARPEFFGESLTPAYAARDSANLRHAEAERGGGVDAKARHPVESGGIGQGAEFREDFFSRQACHSAESSGKPAPSRGPPPVQWPSADHSTAPAWDFPTQGQRLCR